MAELPKIVAERLQSGAKSQTHPDPDLLSAFVERLLSPREQNQVLEHLAHCSDCREVVALSLPESAETAAVRARPAAFPLLSSPVMRWAASVACIVVVGVAITWRYESRSRSRQLIAAHAPEVAQLDERIVQPPAQSKLDTAQAENQISSAPLGATRDAFSTPAPGARRKATPNRSVSPPATEIAGTAGKVAGEPKSALESTGALEVSAAAEPASPAPNSAMDELVPGRAKEAESPTLKDNFTAMAGLAAGRKTAAALALNKPIFFPASGILPRWTLTSDGTLQRSLDSGKTWETIPVNSQANFRALAANGFDIWVGGAKGALYHSSDAGQHWTQVRPIANGESLGADIIGVEFPDPQHGMLSTSAQETWTTDDAGLSWQKK
jgi:hypothetical protein